MYLEKHLIFFFKCNPYFKTNYQTNPILKKNYQNVGFANTPFRLDQLTRVAMVFSKVWSYFSKYFLKFKLNLEEKITMKFV